MNEVIGVLREGFDDVFLAAEIVKGAVFIAPDLECYRCLPNVIVVGLDSCPLFRGFDLDHISDRAIRTLLGAWRG